MDKPVANMVPSAEAFSVWWNADGRFLDPDTSDVPWFDKREALAEYAYLAAASEAATLISSQHAELLERIMKLPRSVMETENNNGDVFVSLKSVIAALKEA